MSKYVIGYDPGGEKANGIAYLKLSDDNLKIEGYDHAFCDTASEALFWLFERKRLNSEDIICAGIDTLMSWPTIGTFRPMDYFLKREYPEVEKSVFSSNSAYGAMALQGMLFAQMLSDCAPNIQFINETHPKVAYYAIAKPTRHDYLNRVKHIVSLDAKSTTDGTKEVKTVIKKEFNEIGAKRMWNELHQWINTGAVRSVPNTTSKSISNEDHEWDALFSAWFTYHYGYISPTDRNLMDLEKHGLLDLGLSNEQTSQIKLLKNLGNNLLVEKLKARISVPSELKKNVKYLWLPNSETKAE